MKRVLLVILPILFLTLSLIVLWQTKAKIQSSSCCGPKDLSGEVDRTAKLAIYEGEEIEIPTFALADENSPPVLGISNNERFIEVDLSEQKLRAWDGNNLFLESLVSTGLPWWPTPKGEFTIWLKLRSTKMEGGSGKYYYYLPNVPYVMYFEGSGIPAWRGYGLHGTYWHNDFGRTHSHGCVNLPTNIAEQLYYWTSPQMPEGKGVVWSSVENPGTRIIIHE
jgi:hypothetical protein